MIDVFLNEQFIGGVQDKDEFIKSVKEKRWENKLPSTLNIRYDDEFN